MQWKATGRVQTNASRPDQRWITFTGAPATRQGITGSSLPKMRAAVVTCTSARNPAAEANHTLPTIGALKTLVMMWLYVEATLAIMAAHATRYDPAVSRLVVLPAALFAVVSGGAFALAKLHLAKPGAPAARAVQLGDAHAGQTAFAQKCAACHGPSGRGGGIGPKLAGVQITLTRAQMQIDVGGGVMPGGLVSGKAEADVLAYLATILKKG